MSCDHSLLAFTIGDSRFGVDLGAVQEVLPAVALTQLPGAPEVIYGLMNLRGRVLPVVDLSFRFWRIRTNLLPSHRFIVVQTAERTIALSVESVGEIMEYDHDSVESRGSVHVGSQLMKGVIRDEEGLVLLHDIGSCLTRYEEDILSTAMQELSSTVTAE